jgi:hypothetical protein
MDKLELAKRLVEVIDDRAAKAALKEINDTAVTTRDMVRCAIEAKHETGVEVIAELLRRLSPASLEAVVEHFHLDYPERSQQNASRSRTG